MNYSYHVLRPPFLIFFTLFYGLAFGQRNIKLDHLTVDDGLSQGNVNVITQDRLGFMWMGTRDGLNLYNGYDFEIFRNDPEDSTTITNNYIRCIVEDQKGNFWIGTLNGLNYYNRAKDSFKRYYHDPDFQSSLPNDNIISLLIDTEGEIWVGTANGLCRYETESDSFERYVHRTESNIYTNDNVKCITQDQDGILWLGTGNGLFRFEKNARSFIKYSFDENDANTLSSNDVYALYVDDLNNLWIGTYDNGINRLDDGRRFVTRYGVDPNSDKAISNRQVQTITQDANGRIWIGTDVGLNVLGADGRIEKYFANSDDDHALSSSIVLDVFIDSDERVWIGTMYGGINTYDPGKYGFKHYKRDASNPKSLNHNNVTDFAEDAKGNLWVATDGGGLNYFNRRTGEFTGYVSDPNNTNSITNDKLLAAKLDDEGILWIGMWNGGLNSYDPNMRRFTRYLHDPEDPTSIGDNRVFDITTDNNGDIWFATYGNGLGKFDRQSKTFSTYNHDPNNPSTIAENAIIYMHIDHLGHIWLATGETGLDVFDPTTEKVRHYTSGDGEGSISENVVNCIFEDSKERLWVGTNGGGLNLYNREGDSFSVIRRSDGLPNDVINGILEDDEGVLWISTNHGLSRFNPEEMTFKNYDKSDGLQSNEFNRWAFFKLNSGEMAFGGSKGFNVFHPDDLQENVVPPAVYVTNFKLYNEKVEIVEKGVLNQNIIYTNDITLDYNQNYFSFEFIGLNYRQTEKNEYQYYLEGFEDDWIDSEKLRTVSYTNVEPGEYTFKVKASNNDGKWSEKNAEIRIEITPPLWSTWWFRIAAGLAVVGLIFWYQRSKSIQNKNAQEILKMRINEATKQVEQRNAELEGHSESLQLAIEETNHVVKEAVESGNFNARIDTDSKTGEWKSLGESINQLFESVSLPFSSINQIVTRLAKGDLTERFRGEARGEIGQVTDNLNLAIENLTQLVGEITLYADDLKSSSNEMLSSSVEMNSSTGEIASSISEMSKGAQEQVAKVDESSNLIEGVLKSSGEMGDQAVSINSTAKLGVEKSEEGKGSMDELDMSMKDILDFSAKTNESVLALTKRSEEISTVLRIIKDIASQTNLLALNAAIEAAQAGESGRGFAVVAEEIRKLAEDSKKSAGEIEELVKGVQDYTSSTAELMSQMDSRIQLGEQATEQSKKAFVEISKYYSETLALSEQILTATKQQTSDIGDVVNIINGVVVIAEETAAGTEETAASSNQLSAGMVNYTDKSKRVSEIADELSEKVGKFVLSAKAQIKEIEEV